jgi:hypothetical protein
VHYSSVHELFIALHVCKMNAETAECEKSLELPSGSEEVEVEGEATPTNTKSEFTWLTLK